LQVVFVLVGLAAPGCLGRESPPASVPDREETAHNEKVAIERLYREAVRLDDAEELSRAEVILREALPRARRLQPPNPRLVAAVLNELAENRLEAQSLPEARRRASEALSLVEPGPLEDARRLYKLHLVLAESYLREKRPEHALEFLSKALGDVEAHQQATAPEQFEALNRLAETQTDLTRYADAVLTRERALALAEQSSQLADSSRDAAVHLAIAFDRAGRSAEAEQLSKRYGMSARKLLPKAATAVDISLEEAVKRRDGDLGKLDETEEERVAEELEKMRPSLTQCLVDAMPEPDFARCRIRVVVRVASNGGVSEALALAWEAAPLKLTDCVLRRFIDASFQAPKTGSAIFAVPLDFAP
jgi:tetratricopeptide (TPR) repeat protein